MNKKLISGLFLLVVMSLFVVGCTQTEMNEQGMQDKPMEQAADDAPIEDAEFDDLFMDESDDVTIGEMI